jgi:putative nucleotidyltransferase with HDIG domain
MSVEEIRALVETECRSTSNVFGPAFFDQHILPVAHYAGALARRLGADTAVVELAAYLHDLSAVRDVATLPTHAADSARIARAILLERGFAPEVAGSVYSCIDKHGAPVTTGQGTFEEICVSNADVMSHVARPAFWLFYQYRLRSASYEDGVQWLKMRVETAWNELVEEAKDIAATERDRTVQLLRGAGVAI